VYCKITKVEAFICEKIVNLLWFRFILMEDFKSTIHLDVSLVSSSRLQFDIIQCLLKP